MAPDDYVWRAPGRFERVVSTIFNSIFRVLEIMTWA